jgi:hypothetical protein
MLATAPRFALPDSAYPIWDGYASMPWTVSGSASESNSPNDSDGLSLEVVPQREHGRSHESDDKHGHSPPRFQATCHPPGRLPPALTAK